MQLNSMVLARVASASWNDVTVDGDYTSGAHEYRIEIHFRNLRPQFVRQPTQLRKGAVIGHHHQELVGTSRHGLVHRGICLMQIEAVR